MYTYTTHKNGERSRERKNEKSMHSEQSLPYSNGDLPFEFVLWIICYILLNILILKLWINIVCLFVGETLKDCVSDKIRVSFPCPCECRLDGALTCSHRRWLEPHSVETQSLVSCCPTISGVLSSSVCVLDGSQPRRSSSQWENK